MATLRTKGFRPLAVLFALYLASAIPAFARTGQCPARHSALNKPSARAEKIEALGNHYLVDDEFAKALPLIKQATQLAPKQASYWQDLGVCYSQMGNITQAIAADRMAARLKPSDAMTLNNLAIALNKAGKHAEAVAMAHRVIKAVGSDDPSTVETMNHIIHQ